MSRERALRFTPGLIVAAALSFWAGRQPLFSAPNLLETEHRAPKSKVVVVHDQRATEAFKPVPHVVRSMVDRGVTNATAKPDVVSAWRSLVQPIDIVGIKVHSVPGGLSGTRKTVVEAVLEGLLAAGIPATNIVVWDKSGLDLRQAGYYELAERYRVRVTAGAQAGYDYSAYYDSPIIGNLVWGDFDFGRGFESMGRKSYLTQLASREITKIINIAPLLNHNLAGVSGLLYSLAMGAVDNSSRFETDIDRLAQAVPEIYATEWLSDKVVLNILDALICQYEGSERALLHYSLPLNELWIGTDPVALDTLAMLEITKQRNRFIGSRQKPKFNLYANAALLELGTCETNQMQVVRLKDLP